MTRALETLALFPGDSSLPQSEPRVDDCARHKLWLAIYFPKLVLESLPATSSDEATVVTESWDGATRVIAANEAATGLGIRPNLKLSAAFALSESLNVLKRCAASEQAKLEALAGQAGRFTSVVSLESPNALLLEIGGSLRLFGGAGPIKGPLADVFQQQQITAHFCAAPTALAALWLARSGGSDVLSREELVGSLSSTPLEATAWPDKTRALLRSMGVRTLGDCMRLPRDGFARRVGRQYLDELDKSRGSHDLRHEFEPALELSVHCELSHETTSMTLLASRGKQLIARLVDDLYRRQIQIPGFECVFHHVDDKLAVETLNLAEPTRQKERLERLFTDRLEHIHLSAPVVALSLKAGPAEPAVASSGALFVNPDGAEPEFDRNSLIERLQARFGMESLYGMALVDEHRPEAAWSKSKQFLQRKRRPPLAAGETPHRPLWLLPAPQRLSRTADNLPCYESHRPLRIEHGPERIESGWWDGGDIGRDYYVASSTHGERLWIFQDHCPNRDWYLHGFFA
jgi:protein ImuB